MKVKIFRGDDIDTTEKLINDFIKDKYVVDIRYSSYPVTIKYNANGTPNTTHMFDSVMIMYEEVTANGH